jgi:DNA-binding XRE family transcriptional regulator
MTKVKDRAAKVRAPKLRPLEAVNIIRDDSGNPLYAILRWDDFLTISGKDGEDAEDAAIIEAALADPERFPADVVNRIADGENTLKVIREWRGLSQEALGEKTGRSKAYISQLETGHRSIGRKTAKVLAPALRVSADVLTD